MNFQNIKFNRGELAGSLGDIGIFLPLALSLINFNGLNSFSIFFIGGMLYIVSGLYYGHPMPVQPLKAFAVTSLAIGASAHLISTASIVMGIILMLIYVTGISDFLLKFFNKPMVRGIQFGLGLMLVKKGIDYILTKEFLMDGNQVMVSFNNHAIPFGLLVGGAALFYAIKFHSNKNIPASLVIIASGLLIGIFTGADRLISTGNSKLTYFPSIHLHGFDDLLPALFLLVIPQIPLTIGNSLFASSDTAKNYFGKAADSTTPARLSIGLGITNIVVGLFGGMPLCHGAGGLTAHYRFGARTAGSNIIIGTTFIGIAVTSLYLPVSYLHLIPVSILGSLLIFTGLEHAMLIEDLLHDRDDLFVALFIGSIAVITSNLFIGCVIGFAAKLWIGIGNKIEIRS